MAAKRAADRQQLIGVFGRPMSSRQVAGGSVVEAGYGDHIARAGEHWQSAHTILRSEVFAALYLLGIVNAGAPAFFGAVFGKEPWQALALGCDLNIVVIAAAGVGLYLLRQSTDAGMRPRDWLVTAVVGSLLLVPHHAASWLAVTGLALYSLGRERPSTAAVAAASVFLAIAASNFWGSVLVQVFASKLLALDAALAVALLEVLGYGGIERIGNVIVASDQSMLVVGIGCSFLPNLLYGFLWWTAIARAVRPEWRPSDVLALLAVGGLVLAANTLRLALLGQSAASYEWVHGPVGGNVFNIGLLFLIAIIALHSTGRTASSPYRLRNASRGSEPVC
jgi:hypothetical protein